MKATRLLGISIVVLAFSASAEAAVYQWVTPRTFSSSTPTQFDFRGTGDLVITRTTTTGTGTSFASNTLRTYSASAPFNNPAWVAGVDRPLWRVDYDDLAGGSVDTTPLTFTMTFGAPGGFRTTDYMIFNDIDWSESVRIKAYDLSNNLISLSDLVFEFWAGQEVSTPGSWSSWYSTTSLTNYSAVLASTQSGSSEQVVATVRSQRAISQLVYEFHLNPGATDGVSRNAYFNFATPVPEHSAVAVFGPAVLGLLWLRRKRLNG